MGAMEKESAKRTRRANMQKIILSTVAVSGVLATAAVAPNVLGAMDKLGLIPKKRQTEIIKRTRQRLIEKGLLAYTNGHVQLTKKGKEFLLREEILAKGIEHSGRWDKKWRVLIFDIPESRKRMREKIRRTLSAVGFLRLQDSVWIYPHDCEDFVVLLKADFRIGKDLLYLIVDAMENDAAMRSHFGLH